MTRTIAALAVLPLLVACAGGRPAAYDPAAASNPDATSVSVGDSGPTLYGKLGVSIDHVSTD